MAFFKKNKEEKRKKGETIIGKIIYGFLLFAPLFNILVTCMYATFNKNAYQSYSQQEVEYNYRVNDISQYASGLKYKLTTTNTAPSQNGNYHTLSYISLSASDLQMEQNTYNTITKWILLNNGNIVFANDNNTWLKQLPFGVSNPQYTSFEFIGDIGNEFFSYIITFTSIKTQSLDNAFIYGIQKTEDTNLFNWAKTTGTYTVINNTCNLLGITNTFTPMLLAYWLIISIIYFIYDIALILILMVHKKIHELTDSL